ncbi:hypothetical protein PYCCODRAFT_1110253 [Trametes coccinea BRFM310]|uniref:Uncharacterized protein n=1 Tax=Trametes coccinea (strain BRFM310) TaxID=1353009 RepID=A0A1Y2IBB0_TRAC3|nr:hypothetical protein PYCCODRAFT_1110253 [Trametes coccinea BRFM310]
MIRTEPCSIHGSCVRQLCFVPTGSTRPNEPATELDRHRLRHFVQGYNSRIRKPERRAFVGLLKTSSCRPSATAKYSCQEMRVADRAAWDLHGLSRREFAYLYLRQRHEASTEVDEPV